MVTMAYKKADLEEQALKAIKDHNLMFVSDLMAYLPCSSKTFYNKGLQELQTIKEALEQNRIKTKNGLRAKWYNSDNATVQIALYKLISNDKEFGSLTGQRVEISGPNGGPIKSETEFTGFGFLPSLPEKENEQTDTNE